MKNLFFMILLLGLNLNAIDISKIEFDYEASDPYYMNINMYFPLTDEDTEIVTELNEFYMYKRLLIGSLIPKFVYLEASVNVLPVLGTMWNTHYHDNYQQWSIYDTNILEPALSGFEEPYAVSLFLGKIVKFGIEGEKIESSNKGFAGFLISYGDKHIKDMTFIEDKWLEIEWKVKGKKVVDFQNMDWSLRFGTKMHWNENISDTIYFGLKRSNVDLNYTIPFISNSSIEYRVDMGEDFKILRNYLTFDKKVPLFGTTKTVSLLLGFIQESQGKYSGELTRQLDNSYQFIFRPNMTF